jgi:hypothetical protein
MISAFFSEIRAFMNGPTTPDVTFISDSDIGTIPGAHTPALAPVPDVRDILLNANPNSRERARSISVQESLISGMQVSNTEQVLTASQISNSWPENDTDYEAVAFWPGEHSHWSGHGSEEEIDLQPEEIMPLNNPKKLEYRSPSIEAIKDELNNWAGPRVNCILIRRSKKDKDSKLKVYLCWIAPGIYSGSRNWCHPQTLSNCFPNPNAKIR